MHHGGEGDTDPEDEGFDLLPKKEKGKDSDDDSIDLSQLPERVPTDDTSGYQESREELIADAKAQRRTEQCVRATRAYPVPLADSMAHSVCTRR